MIFLLSGSFGLEVSFVQDTVAYMLGEWAEEQLMLHAATALLHNGKFLLADAIKPDGSIVPEEECFHSCIEEADLHRGRISEQINSGF